MAGVFRRPLLMQLVRLGESRLYNGSSHSVQTQSIRGVTRSSRRQAEAHKTDLSDYHSPTNLERKILVWTKMYPNAESIPETVSLTKIRKARDLFRIRVNLAMIFGTVAGCGLMMYTGKKARKEGDSLSKRGLEWQKQLQEQGKQERAAAAANKE